MYLASLQLGNTKSESRQARLEQISACNRNCPYITNVKSTSHIDSLMHWVHDGRLMSLQLLTISKRLAAASYQSQKDISFTTTEYQVIFCWSMLTLTHRTSESLHIIHQDALICIFHRHFHNRESVCMNNWHRQRYPVRNFRFRLPKDCSKSRQALSPKNLTPSPSAHCAMASDLEPSQHVWQEPRMYFMDMSQKARSPGPGMASSFLTGHPRAANIIFDDQLYIPYAEGTIILPDTVESAEELYINGANMKLFSEEKL